MRVGEWPEASILEHGGGPNAVCVGEWPEAIVFMHGRVPAVCPENTGNCIFSIAVYLKHLSVISPVAFFLARK